MSLSSAMYTGVSGLLNNGQAMNVIGNNISNVNTIGYKEARTQFSDMLSQNVGGNSQVGTGVQLQTVQNIFTQGTTATSENVTDLAIQGNSFFTLTDGAATPTKFLSRAGAFSVDSSLHLVNADGYKVLDSTGTAITFPTGGTSATDFSKITKISTDGTITYLATDGTTSVVLGGATPVKVGVTTVANTSLLDKMGGSLYKDTSAAPAGPAAANGTSEQILSNTLEQSNVDMASEFVKMIVTQRAYSANSKTITTTDQMTQEVLGLIR